MVVQSQALILDQAFEAYESFVENEKLWISWLIF